MKYIFNSLGSNYSFPFVLRALLYFFVPPTKAIAMDQLDRQIRHRFPHFELGPYYFYKGRDAVEFVLTNHGVAEGQSVLTQAFSCHALEAAIRRAGGIPAYVDLGKTGLNPTVATIEAAYKKNSDARILIIQHTLGVPANITTIRSWCTKNKIFLIEDLAQAIGGTDEKGELLGTHADAVIFSFGRDKIIDAVNGGACLIKKRPLGFSNENYRTLTNTRFKRDHLYPILTYKIRMLYPFYIGRVLGYIARTFGLIQSPIKPRFEYITAFPSTLAALAVLQFENMDVQLQHRKEIAKIYFSSLEKYCPVEWAVLERGSNLRFALTVHNPTTFLQRLAKHDVYLQDRWYRNPVDSGSLQYFSKYRTGSCPNAEQFAETIINLPTHQNISVEDAEYIVQLVSAQLASER